MPDDQTSGPTPDVPQEPTPQAAPEQAVPTPDAAAPDQPGAAGDDDVAFARLRAADPAAGVTPDADRLRAVVAAATAATADGTARQAPAVPDELAAARSRRSARLRWLPVAAAVAGFVVVGGGGYAVGAARDGGAPAGDQAAPAMVLDQPVQGRAESMAGAADTAMAAEDSAASKLAWFGGRVVFTAGGGLSDEAGRGTAWALDAASVVSAETAARVAAALGVSGEPRQEFGSWTVGATDGSGPSVSVSPDGTASVSYYDPSLDPWACVRSAQETIDGAEELAGTTGEPEPAVVDPGFGVECTNPDLPAAPTGDAALAKARDVLASLGLDPAAFELDVASDTGTPQLVQVTAHQVVAGQRTGIQWNVSLVGDGVQSLWGSLAPFVELGEYDVVSAKDAVARLGDPRFGASGGIMPFMDDTARIAEEGAAADMMPAEPTVPPTASGGPIAWPVEDVTITSARLGVALTTLPDGAAVLLPTYELSADDGRTWTVVAVADDELDFSAVG